MMTTPERLKRRQMIEGCAILAVGLLMCLLAWVDGRGERDQQACIAEQFRKLNVALEVRSGLTKEDRRLDTRMENATGGVIGSFVVAISNPTNARAGIIKSLRKYDRVNASVTAKRAELAKIRAANPVPPYPPGTCEKDQD